MLFVNCSFRKSMLNVGFILLQLFIVNNACARDVTLLGNVINASSSEARPVIRVYLPGTPFLDSGSEWRLLVETSFSKETGAYNVVVDIPDNENNIVLSVAYLAPNTDVISWADVSNNSEISTTINLPAIKNSDLSFKVNILISGNQFDYINNIASCMFVSRGIVANGRLMLMGVYDSWIHKFTASGFPDGEYRIACSIQNVLGITVNNQVPDILKKYKDFTLPLANQDKVLNFDFSEGSTDGIVY